MMLLGLQLASVPVLEAGPDKYKPELPAGKFQALELKPTCLCVSPALRLRSDVRATWLPLASTRLDQTV